MKGDWCQQPAFGLKDRDMTAQGKAREQSERAVALGTRSKTTGEP
jgi:hypothetical protein